MTAGPRCVVVVLNWNAHAATRACLEDLRAELGPADEVVVVDNGSRADDLEQLRADTENFTLLENGTNLGFAGGTRVGVDYAIQRDARYVLWWNNDASPAPGSLQRLLDVAETESLDAAQPLLLDAADPERIDSAGLQPRRTGGAADWLHGMPRDRAPESLTEILGPCGAAALFRVATLRRAGLLDPDLFVLCEDLDQALKVRAVGGRAALVPAAIAHHGRGVSGRPGKPSLRRLRKLWLQRNTLAMALRAWPLAWLVLALPLLCWRALQALVLCRGTEFRCLPLWRRQLAARRATRSALRKHRALTRFFP